jgi:hypothetical protein
MKGSFMPDTSNIDSIFGFFSGSLRSFFDVAYASAWSLLEGS